MGLSTSYSKNETDIKLDKLKKLFGSGIHDKPLKISDPMPSELGGYFLADVGAYSFGTAEAKKLNVAFLSADGWEIIDVDIDTSIKDWVAGNYVQKSLTIKDNAIWRVADGQTAGVGDVPGVSAKWKSLGSDEEVRRALKTFLEPTNPVITLDRTIMTSDTNTFANVYGINDELGILQPNNTILNTTEAGVNTNTWRNIPTKTNSIKRIDLKIRPYGNNPGAINNVNLIGIKNGLFTTLVAYDQGGAPSALQEYSIDVSLYDSVSLSIYRIDAIPNTFEQDVKFYKGTGGTLEEDSVKKYIDAKLVGGSGFDYLDLIDFGAVGDGVADDTSKINQAVVQLINSGGGTIFGRDRKFKVSSIQIPDVKKWLKVEFAGSEMPVPIFGTIGTFPEQNKKQMEFISTLQDTSKAVIQVKQGTNYENFNFAFLSAKNLRIKTYQNPKLHGIDASHAVQFSVENVVIDTGVYNVEAIEPTWETQGLLTPKVNNGAFTWIRNLCISGFYNGMFVEEHTDTDSLIISSCKNALVFRAAAHASYFKRLGLYRNQNQIKFEGKHLFEIAQLNMEYAGVGQTYPENAWQNTLLELKDPSNFGIGQINYANVKGGLGIVSTFRIQGGSDIIVKKIGSENRLTGSGIPA